MRHRNARLALAGLALATPATGQDLSFDPPLTLAGAGSRVEFGQLGPDDDLDVIVGSSSVVRIFHGDGQGGMQASGTANHGSPSMWDMELGDINNDAFGDVAVGDVGNGWVLLGDGQGGFGPPTHMPNGAEAYVDMSLGDVNLDGELDLVHGTDIFGVVHLSLGTPTNLGNGPQWGGPWFSPKTLITDLDANGEPDFLVTQTGNTWVFSNYASTLQIVNFNTGPGPSAVAAGDITGDGNVDYVLGVGGEIRVYAGDGNGGLSFFQSFPTGASPSALLVADMNGDGLPDVVASTSSTSVMSIHLGDGQGGLASAVTLPTTLSPEEFALGDLNADGLLDIVSVGSAGIAIHVNRSYPAIGTNYCFANANSTLLPAALSASGSRRIGVNYLRFHAGQLPPGQFGYFVMADAQAFVPLFGNSQGNLCLALPLVRFSGDILTSGGLGTMEFQPDLTSLPESTVFGPGDTWNFQCWFRDAGHTSNTTDGIAITFETAGAPSVQFPVTLSSIVEQATQISIEVTLSQTAERDVFVAFSNAGSATVDVDYRIETTNPLMIPAGALSAPILVTIAEDAFMESDETVVLDIGAVTGGSPGSAIQHTLTIVDDD